MFGPCKSTLSFLVYVPTYYRIFVPRFADIAKPLTTWGARSDRQLCTTNKGIHFELSNTEGPIRLGTDTSYIGGAVISETRGQRKSNRLLQQDLVQIGEINVSHSDSLLAIVKSTKRFYKYLHDRRFLLTTDHGSLR